MPDADAVPPTPTSSDDASPELLRLLTELEARHLTGETDTPEPWAELARAGATAEILRPLLRRTTLSGLSRLGDDTGALQMNEETAAEPLRTLIGEALLTGRLQPNTAVLQLLSWRAATGDGQQQDGPRHRTRAEIDPLRLAQTLRALLPTLPDTALPDLARTLVRFGPALDGADRREPLATVISEIHARLKRVVENPWSAEQRALARRR
jgi:hypothetical protein